MIMVAGRIKDNKAPFIKYLNNIDYGINVIMSRDAQCCVYGILYSIINIHNVSGAAGTHCLPYFIF